MHDDVPAPDGVDAGQPGAVGPPADLPWAPTAVATDVPPLDDVLTGAAAPSAAASPGDGASRRRRSRSAGVTGRAAGAGRDAAGRVAHGAAGLRRRGVAFARTRPSGRFARRSSLLVATALALVAGVGAGAGLDVVGGAGDSAPAPTAALLTTEPETCATAQVAWSRAAAAQVQMDLESPRSLRTGFVTARDALTGLTPPAEVAADWSTVATYVTVVADAAEEAKNSEVEAAVAEAMSGLDTAAMTTASERVTTHLAADCATPAQ